MLEVAQRWTPRIGLAVLDQGLTSGGTFLLSLLLARWLPPSEYGAFAIGVSALLFLAGVQNALVIEPLSVLGPAKTEADRDEYLLQAISGNTILTLSFGAICVLVGVGLLVAGLPWSTVSLALGLAVPCVLSFWCLRRIAYVMFRPGKAVLGSATYFVALLVLSIALRGADRVSAPAGLVALAAAAVAGWLSIAMALRSEGLHMSGRRMPLPRKDTLEAHWAYGRWVLGSAVVFWFGGPAYVPLVGVAVGIASSGTLKAAQNLFQPLSQGLAGLGLLFLPWMASFRERVSSPLGSSRIRSITILFMFCSVAYAGWMALSGEQLADSIYGHGTYVFPPLLLPTLAALAMAESGNQVVGLVLRSSQRSDLVFWSQLASAVVTILVGVALVHSWGLEGAGVAMVLASTMGLGSSLLLLLGLRRTDKGSSSIPSRG